MRAVKSRATRSPAASILSNICPACSMEKSTRRLCASLIGGLETGRFLEARVEAMAGCSSQRDVSPISTAELEEFRRSLRRFVERELMPFERQVMSDTERAAIERKAKDAGYWLMDVPEHLGGQGF